MKSLQFVVNNHIQKYREKEILSLRDIENGCYFGISSSYAHRIGYGIVTDAGTPYDEKKHIIFSKIFINGRKGDVYYNFPVEAANIYHINELADEQIEILNKVNEYVDNYKDTIHFEDKELIGHITNENTFIPN